MAKRYHTPGTRLHPTKTSHAPILPPADSEGPWQQLMLFTYILYETQAVMAQERAKPDQPQPLHRSWQQFTGHLYRQKPQLKRCVENLHQALLAEQEGRP